MPVERKARDPVATQACRRRVEERPGPATQRGHPPQAGRGRSRSQAAVDFSSGALVLTEARSAKRASLRVVAGEAALRALDPGGLEPLEASLEEFRAALARENHTLKRSLTDPRLWSGIGNAYSDEIL